MITLQSKISSYAEFLQPKELSSHARELLSKELKFSIPEAARTLSNKDMYCLEQTEKLLQEAETSDVKRKIMVVVGVALVVSFFAVLMLLACAGMFLPYPYICLWIFIMASCGCVDGIMEESRNRCLEIMNLMIGVKRKDVKKSISETAFEASRLKLVKKYQLEELESMRDTNRSLLPKTIKFYKSSENTSPVEMELLKKIENLRDALAGQQELLGNTKEWQQNLRRCEDVLNEWREVAAFYKGVEFSDFKYSQETQREGAGGV